MEAQDSAADGALRALGDSLTAGFNGDSTFGEPGDSVHPSRAGHAALARCILENL